MELKYTIEKKLGILAEKDKGWKKELNIVNWNDKGGKFDIRDWDSDHNRMGKGITMNEDEMLILYELLKKYFNEETVKATNDICQSKDITDYFLK